MFRRSSRLAGLQAGTVKLATAMNNCGSLFVSESDLISELDSSAHFNLESKTCSEELQQDIPHSSVTDSSRESSSDDFASSFQTKYQHESRDSNLRNDVNYSRKPKIIFPQSNDPRWNEWNSELEVLLPQNFTYRKTRSLSATELSESFDNFIYDFFVEKLGEDAFAKPSSTQKPRGNYENKTMKKLRRQKKNCKKAYKALIKAGCGDSDEAHELKKK